MPTIFLSANDIFPIGANSRIFGVQGNSQETVILTDNRATDIEIYPSIERIEFPSSVTDYQFQIIGNIATIAIDGHTLATLVIDDKTELVFTDGSANLSITGLGQAQLGNVALPSELGFLNPPPFTPADSIFSLSPVTQNILEGAEGTTNTATVTVTRIDNLSNAVSVDLESIDLGSVNSSATVGDDFLAFATTLNFAENESSKDVTITVLGDNLFENDETIHIELSNPSSGATIASGASVDITIQDDDPLPTFALARSFSDTVLEPIESELTGIDFMSQDSWII